MNAPGRYCLARCYCGSCPQYAEQMAAVQVQREQEHAGRVRRQAEKEAARRGF